MIKKTLSLAILIAELFFCNFAEASNCDDTFNIHDPSLPFWKASFALPSSGILNRGDRDFIANLLADKKRTPEQQWRAVSHKILQARVRSVPPQYKQKAFAILADLEARFHIYVDKMVANQREIILPAFLRGTPLVALIEAHEREHRLQFLSASPTNNMILLAMKNFNYQFNPYEMHRQESDAISAEWEVASVISESEALRTIEIFDSLIYSPFKTTLVSILDSRSLSSTEYLLAQHKNNRYSLQQTHEAAQSNIMAFWMSMFRQR